MLNANVLATKSHDAFSRESKWNETMIRIKLKFELSKSYLASLCHVKIY